MEFFQVDSCCWSITPLCSCRETCYLYFIAYDFVFTYSERFCALGISISCDDELYHEKSQSEYHTDEDVVFIHNLPERYLKRFIHFVEWKLFIHSFVCELISMFVFFSKNCSIGDFSKSRNDAFCFLVEYFEACVFDFVDSLELFDDELAIHHEMDFCASEFLHCFEPQDCSHIFCLIVSCISEEKFPSFYHFASLAHDKGTPAWSWVSS